MSNGKKIIELTEKEIESKRRTLIQCRFNKASAENTLRNLEKMKETGFHKKRFEEGIKQLKKTLDSGKDVGGNDLSELDKLDIQIQIDCRTAELENEFPDLNLLNSIVGTKEKIKTQEQNIKALEKMIRERKISTG